MLCVAVVPTGPEGPPRALDQAPVVGCRKREFAGGAKRWFPPGSEVVTNGLRC